MKGKYAHLHQFGTILVLLALPFASFGEQQQLKCRGKINDVQHTFVLELKGGQVIGFNYNGMNAQMRDCSFAAKRQEIKSWAKSEWFDHSEETAIAMSVAGDSVGRVSITNKSSAYELRILEITEGSCGVGATIYPVVRLVPGKDECEFPR